jgi:hypothetical protein
LVWTVVTDGGVERCEGCGLPAQLAHVPDDPTRPRRGYCGWACFDRDPPNQEGVLRRRGIDERWWEHVFPEAWIANQPRLDCFWCGAPADMFCCVEPRSDYQRFAAASCDACCRCDDDCGEWDDGRWRQFADAEIFFDLDEPTENTAATPDDARRWRRESSHRVHMYGLASHPNCPPDVIASLVDWIPDYGYNEYSDGLAMSYSRVSVHVPTALLLEWSVDPDPSRRLDAARCAGCPPWLREQLKADPDPRVARAATNFELVPPIPLELQRFRTTDGAPMRDAVTVDGPEWQDPR